jgi:hypothetical protein
MRFTTALLTVSLLSVASGCGDAPQDLQAIFDEEVRTSWKENWHWVEGIAFLESGGLYADTGDPEDQPLDRPNVLPLLRRLKEAGKLDWQAVVDKDDHTMAVAIVAKLPGDPEAVARIKDILAEEQQHFPGAILEQWGYQWLSLDFLNREQAAFEDDVDQG